MPANIQELFSFTPLMEMVNEIEPGLPELVDNSFWTMKQTVVGNTLAIPLGVGARNLARLSPYMGAARQAQKYDLSMKNAVCMHFHEGFEFSQELIQVWRAFAEYGAQSNRALDLVEYQCKNFRQKFDNTRNAAVMSILARDGKIHFDANGNMLPTSSGAVDTFDNGVPAANVGTMGGIFSTWSSGADIPTQVKNFLAYAQRQTGKKITTAYYGKGVSGRLANNTSFQQYLARNPGYNDYYKNTGEIADGTLGLKWVPVQDAYFVDQTDTAQEFFRADYITFTPDLKGNYMFLEGSAPIHPDANMVNVGSDVTALLRGLKEINGIGTYAKAQVNPLVLQQYIFDTFAPVILTPNSWYWANVG